MSVSPYGAMMPSTEPVDTSRFSGLHDSDSGSEVDLRRVQIQAIPHSTISAVALRAKGGTGGHTAAAGAAADADDSDDGGDDDDVSGTGLPYGLPSAANGLPSVADTTRGSGEDAAAPEGRKGGGLRAALASKFAAKKKPKDLRATTAVSTKRQQHQLESLMSLSGAAGRDTSSGPMVGGQPVGHPMSFQHVEHLSPTDIAPKMPLINRRLHKAAEAPAKGPAPPERRLKFRNFKPAALLTKPSKASVGSAGSGNAGDADKGAAVMVRGKPIGAPVGFQHVDHLSPTEYSMQQFHLLNHRQQQSEIVSVLRQNSESSSELQRRRAPSLVDKHDKITFRGLPVSGPVSFAHVEHVSPREYQRHLGDSARKASAATAADSEDMSPSAPPMPRPASGNTADADAAADFNLDAAGEASDSSDGASADRPRIAALQHTSQSARTAASEAGLAKPPRINPSMIKELQARARQPPPGDGGGINGSSSNLPKARAGITKAREISSPFNVQHDVHISVEDLDDLMNQVPETWKPYISPHWSPKSDHRSSETQDTPTSQPRTPIYEEMTANRRRSTGNDEQLAAQLARTRLAASRDSAGPSTPGWLPHIVSVSSPDNLTPLGLRKSRTASANSTGHRASHMSAAAATARAAVASSPTANMPRAPTPVSAPIRADANSHAYDAPGTPQSASGRIGDAEPVAGPTSWDTGDDDDGDGGDGRGRVSGGARTNAVTAAAAAAASGSTAGPEGHEPAAPEGAHAKWIKRKSRAVSTLSTAMMARHMSKAPAPAVPVPTLTLDTDKRHTLSQNNISNAARAKAAAIARLEMNAAPTATSSLPPGDEHLSGRAAGGHGGSISRRSGEQRPTTTSSGKSSKKRRENYGELEEYAEGESGNVFITTRKSTTGKRARGDHVAVKVVPKTAKTRYRKLRTELNILRRIRSQHVVRFFEYLSIDDCVWIVYEFMGRGSITDLLAGYPEIRMPAITISYTMHKVLTALAYLHERHIIHCDVRSDNVLIDDKGQVKLADFSSAVLLDADQTLAQKPVLGAIYWLAPELAKGAGYSASTDVWAAGALLYEMLEGQPPYIEYPDIKVLELSQSNGMPKLSNPAACDASLVDLMRQCTASAPADRPPAVRLRKHESVISPESAQCAKLMIDFVLQVESLEVDCDDAGDAGTP
ncbi:hypothetical protein LPJ61_003846 [Coemansia biformis]|uniref:Non-specific serine/threonine protein kinase n=1 Tax=Coemansia biformis TaxID=1286918 RepID=A0A9W7YD31_9FUNG|nr:hypothetical protein LPJ61_003846 [Coemansia biformis]